MSENFQISRLRKTTLDPMRANSELYTAVEEFIEEPSQSSLNVIASKLKGFNSTSDIFQETIKNLIREIKDER